MKVYGGSRWKTQFHTVSATADIEDAIADGIIVVAAAGNDNSYIARDSDSDWDNKMTVSAPAFNYTASIYYNRPAGPSAPKKSIVVGSLAFDRYQKAEYSQFGPRIDLFACGSAISSVDNKYQMGYYTMIDPTRNDSEYGWEMNQGTSMAAPQVCGMMACVLESVPSLTADEAKQMLVQWSRKNQMQGNNTVWSKTSYEQLGNFYGSDFVGSPNRIARQPYLKQKTGNTAMPYKLRSTTGLAYPRSRVRRRG
jgi:subtilisin family serine protease